MDYRRDIKKETEESIQVKQRILAECIEEINVAAKMMVNAVKQGKKIYLCGNGGSASDSQHIACELVGRLRRKSIAVPAIALVTNIPVLTAIANDLGYEDVFSKQIEVFGTAGDILVAITTSGESRNVIKAVESAKEKQMKILVMTGKVENSLTKLADCAIMVPSTDTPRIQEAHILIGHILALCIEKAVSN